MSAFFASRISILWKFELYLFFGKNNAIIRVLSYYFKLRLIYCWFFLFSFDAWIPHQTPTTITYYTDNTILIIITIFPLSVSFQCIVVVVAAVVVVAHSTTWEWLTHDKHEPLLLFLSDSVALVDIFFCVRFWFWSSLCWRGKREREREREPDDCLSLRLSRLRLLVAYSTSCHYILISFFSEFTFP